ncbi:NCS1 family transporter [Petroclostridium sp. X23]|uniref:NCS1 family transporter n=1 Tax=Petroclostridium sp. X23 TaxID=3045146 RepID=UPI0024AD344D|nr:NCS1 family transporter [Petroclostridium sp. X23]WHH60570.1 NCS1 family transporter [Petroclostridium sp. X23]
MSNENSAGANHVEDTLLPIPEDKRILGKTSYLTAWLGGCISIGTFALGSSIVQSGLSLMQAGLAMLIGSLILIAGLILNDRLSYKTGIPYVVQLKSAFGTKGTIVPSLLRAAPAIVWYGVQSWLAGTALNEVSKTLFGFDNVIFFFIAFQITQMLLSLLGFKGVKWIENIGAIFIVGALTYMFYVCLTTYGDVISEKLINKQGTWGLPFWTAIISFFGVNITVMLNAGDYVRELKPGYSDATRGVVYFLAMVPATVFMGIIGLMITTATGIANPIVAFSSAVDNKILVVSTLLFIIFAQMTTNLLSNVIPPVYALMDAFKLKHKTAATLVSVIAVCTFPWELVKESSAAGLDVFIQTYTVFFGPIFAVLLTDYYIIRKQKVDLNELYDEDGPFKGVNYAAIAAIVIGAAFGFINRGLSFFISFIPTMAAYYILMKNLPSSRPFCRGTSLCQENVPVQDIAEG